MKAALCGFFRTYGFNRKLILTMPLQTKDFSVGIANAVLEDGASVTVEVDSTFKMPSGSSELAYELFNTATGGTALATGGEYCTFTAANVEGDLAHTVNGRITCNPAQIARAGAYTGTMTFDITYQ